jgi:hypothetical protein
MYAQRNKYGSLLQLLPVYFKFVYVFLWVAKVVVEGCLLRCRIGASEIRVVWGQ